MKTILLTGFEPFGGSHINPSIEACKPHDGKTINDSKIKVYEIPLVYDGIRPNLINAIEETEPDAVISTGQSSSGTINLERIAINIADARIAYNCGTKPVDRTIVDGGPDGYFSTLPWRRILNSLIDAKIPAALSNSAGTFGCNHIFYELMHYRTQEHLEIPAGFIHVPSLPEQVIENKRPSMSLELISKAMGIALESVSQTL